MSGYISIGAVFANAWRILRRRFVVLLLLNLLQSMGLALLLLWRNIFTLLILASGAGSQPRLWMANENLRYGVPILGASLFLLASIGMMLATRQHSPPVKPPYWLTLFKRFLPASTAVALCFGVITLVFYGWVRIIDQISAGFYTRSAMAGATLATLALLIALSSIAFVILPASVLETGGPLRAIRRSFFLTGHQRWRIAAIILILIVGLLLTFIAASRVVPLIAASLGVVSFALAPISISVVYAGFLLILTLVIASAYHQMVLLKDGITAEGVRRVFE